MKKWTAISFLPHRSTSQTLFWIEETRLQIIFLPWSLVYKLEKLTVWVSVEVPVTQFLQLSLRLCEQVLMWRRGFTGISILWRSWVRKRRRGGAYPPQVREYSCCRLQFSRKNSCPLHWRQETIRWYLLTFDFPTEKEGEGRALASPSRVYLLLEAIWM